MAILHKRLTDPTYIASSVGAVFTQPAAQKTYIKLIIIHNTNTSSETVALHLVMDNAGSVGTASSANRTHNLSILPDETLQIEFGGSGLILQDQNETLQAVTTTASKVVISIFGAYE